MVQLAVLLHHANLQPTMFVHGTSETGVDTSSRAKLIHILDAKAWAAVVLHINRHFLAALPAEGGAWTVVDGLLGKVSTAAVQCIGETLHHGCGRPLVAGCRSFAGIYFCPCTCLLAAHTMHVFCATAVMPFTPRLLMFMSKP